jgi:hypothetical protein
MNAGSTVAVECYSGHTFAERPTALIWKGRRHSIAKILNQWRSPNGPGFQVVTADGARFDLTYCETRDEWSLHLPPDAQKRSFTHPPGTDAESPSTRTPHRKENQPDA